MLRLRVLGLALSPLVLFFASAPAQAKFTVCNKTEHPLSVAIGRYQEKAWVSEGWWKVEPPGCADILRPALKAPYYYLRGVHMGVDGAWDGNRYFCVKADNFTIKGRENCKKRGLAQAGFFEIDTGDYTDWVQNLSD
jgi:uncharacterized membrane protein